MSRILAALRSLAAAVGPDGALLLTGTASLSVAASFIAPAGPWLVWGVGFVAYGAVLVWASTPRRPTP